MVLKKTPNRAIILVASTVTGSFSGAIYIWSIFTNPLIVEHGWDVQQISFAYSLFLLVSTFSAIMSGRLQELVDTRILILVAGLMEALGWGGSGFATSIPMLYFLFGVVGGIGDGVVYNLSVTVATTWYPEKPGFASGICTGCMALSALVFAPLGQFLVGRFGVLLAFRLFGLIVMGFFLCFGWLLRLPPAGYVPPVKEGAATKKRRPRALPQDYTRSQMLRQPLFWVIWVALLFACSSGLMVTAHASGIGQLLVGMTADQGALMIGVFAVGNFAGRFFFANLSDRIGTINSVMVIMALTAGEMLFLYGSASTFPVFMAQTCVLGVFFGGLMSNLPLLASHYFGFRYFGKNYPIAYSGYCFAALVGPMVAANVLARTGTYSQGFTIAGVLALASLLLFLIVRFKAESLRGRVS